MFIPASGKYCLIIKYSRFDTRDEIARSTRADPTALNKSKNIGRLSIAKIRFALLFINNKGEHRSNCGNHGTILTKLIGATTIGKAHGYQQKNAFSRE